MPITVEECLVNANRVIELTEELLKVKQISMRSVAIIAMHALGDDSIKELCDLHPEEAARFASVIKTNIKSLNLTDDHIYMGARVLLALYRDLDDAGGDKSGHDLKQVFDRFQTWAFAHNYTISDTKEISLTLAMMTTNKWSLQRAIKFKRCERNRGE